MKAVRDEQFAAFIRLASTRTASAMQETIARTIQVMETQVSTKHTSSPQATPPSFTAPISAPASAQRRPIDLSSAAMGKETLYSDGRGGEISPFAGSIESIRHSGQGRGGMVLSRYSGDMETLYNDRQGRSGMGILSSLHRVGDHDRRPSRPRARCHPRLRRRHMVIVSGRPPSLQRSTRVNGYPLGHSLHWSYPSDRVK